MKNIRDIKKGMEAMQASKSRELVQKVEEVAEIHSAAATEVEDWNAMLNEVREENGDRPLNLARKQITKLTATLWIMISLPLG